MHYSRHTLRAGCSVSLLVQMKPLAVRQPIHQQAFPKQSLLVFSVPGVPAVKEFLESPSAHEPFGHVTGCLCPDWAHA